MKTTVNLESKDTRAIIAKFFNIPIENVIPTRYSFSIVGLTEHEIALKLNGGESNENSAGR